MELVKQWTLTVSVTLLVSIVFSILSPSGNMGRFYKIILSMFIFISFIVPISSAKTDIKIPEFESEIIIDNQEIAYENIVENTIKSFLKNKGVKNSKVSASVTYSDNLISVNSLKIVIQDEYDSDEVKALIKDEMGYNSEVYYLGE